MLSKAQSKYIRSLATGKGRAEHQSFIAEGEKLAREWLLSAAPIEAVFATGAWIDVNAELLQRHPEAAIHTMTESELGSVSQLATPSKILLTVPFLKPEEAPKQAWSIACETLQDPGNLGTIIRIADWFGIGHVVLSQDSADPFAPKVVQSAMGGHLRVHIHRIDLPTFLSTSDAPILAAILGGENVHSIDPLPAATLLIGNESKGLSQSLIDLATHRITIPRKGGAESLNAAVSAGIICSLLVPQ
jgi:TrmH family RNA methyltransferase